MWTNASINVKNIPLRKPVYIFSHLLAFENEKLEAGGEAQWWDTLLACTKSEVPSPVPEKKNKVC